MKGAIPVFSDTDFDFWNMDPIALEKTFEMYPKIKLVVHAGLYGFSENLQLIKGICEEHGTLLSKQKPGSGQLKQKNTAWYRHEKVGYDYRISNVISGVIHNQYLH